MIKVTRIYVLRDPRNNEIRYVGKTVAPLKKRLSSHLHDSKTKKSHRGRWIASLTKIDLAPVIEEIEQAGENWAERERFWIAFYRTSIPNLTNECDGGEGASGAVRSAQWRERKSAEVRAVSTSEDWKARMVASDPKYWTPELRAERSAKVRAQMTPQRIAEHARKVKETMSSPEWIAAHSKREKSKWTPEMRAAQAARTRAQFAAKKPPLELESQ